MQTGPAGFVALGVGTALRSGLQARFQAGTGLQPARLRPRVAVVGRVARIVQRLGWWKLVTVLGNCERMVRVEGEVEQRRRAQHAGMSRRELSCECCRERCARTFHGTSEREARGPVARSPESQYARCFTGLFTLAIAPKPTVRKHRGEGEPATTGGGALFSTMGLHDGPSRLGHGCKPVWGSPTVEQGAICHKPCP